MSRSAALRVDAPRKSSAVPLRKAVKRMSRSIWLSLMARLPTATATRSMTSAVAGERRRRKMIGKDRSLTVAARKRSGFVISERLPDRKEELEMTGPLNLRRAKTGIRTVRRGVRPALEELLHRPLESVEARRIDAVREIQPDRPYRRSIADSETRGVDHVIEVLKVPLSGAKGDPVDAAVHVPPVMEKNAADVVAQQREPQLGLMEE